MYNTTLETSGQIASLGTEFFWNSCTLIFFQGLTGVYILALAISMRILLQKQNTGRAHKFMILLLLMGCGLVVLCTCGNWIACLVQLNFGLLVSLPGGLEAQEILADSHTNAIFISQDIAGNLMVLVADAIIVWRAWAICGESRITKIILVILMLADMSINIVDAIFDANPMVLLDSADTTTWDWLAPVMNLAVNMIATLLIAYKAWTHHNSIQALSHNRKTQAQAILLLFIESGTAYAVIQVLFIAFAVLDLNAIENSPIDNATLFISFFYMISSGLIPLAIVILVHTENTYEHSVHLEDVSSLPVQSIDVR